MFMSHHLNAGQNYNIKIANKSFENVGNTNILNYSDRSKLNSEGVMNGLCLGNAYCH